MTLHYKCTILYCAISILLGQLLPMQFMHTLSDPFSINNANELVVLNNCNGQYLGILGITIFGRIHSNSSFKKRIRMDDPESQK